MSDELDDFHDVVGSEAPDQPENVWVAAPTTSQVLAQAGISAAAKLSRGSSQWATQNDRFWGISESLERLPSACYKLGVTQTGVYLYKFGLSTDNLLELPDSKVEKVMAEIEEFTQLKDAFKKHGFLYKRGVLLWGPPGSGKTSCIHLVIRLFTQQMNGIAVLADAPAVAIEGLRLIRSIEPERMIVCVLEDLDEKVQQYATSDYLSLLDGEAQIDNVLFIATSNFPERLDKRFVDRPSRFDTVEYVGMPSAAARRTYLLAKEPELTEETLDAMVAVTEGLSVAHLREMIILTQCFGKSVEEAGKRLNASKQRPPNSERAPDGPAGAGFVSHNYSQVESINKARSAMVKQRDKQLPMRWFDLNREADETSRQ